MGIKASFLYTSLNLSDLIIDTDLVMVDSYTGEPRKVTVRIVDPPIVPSEG